MPIVKAVGISVGALDPNQEGVAARIAEAMRQEVLKCHAEGILHKDDEVRSRMHAAHLKVKKEAGL
jgi:hypothetical protein